MGIAGERFAAIISVGNNLRMRNLPHAEIRGLRLYLIGSEWALEACGGCCLSLFESCVSLHHVYHCIHYHVYHCIH